MTASSSPPSPEPGPASATYAMDAETQARKRAEIGLAPHRPTAPTTVQRPPSATPSWVRWLAVAAMSLLLLVVVAMVGARSSTLPWAAASQPVTPQPAFAHTPPAGFTPWLADDFTGPSPYVAEFAQPPELTASVVPAEGVYRMQVGPGQIGWSLFDTSTLTGYYLETEAQVAEGSPEAAAGIVARFADSDNFYLFAVDGQGQFFVALVRDGESSLVQTPVHLPFIHPAGQGNTLAVEDTAAGLEFSVYQVGAGGREKINVHDIPAPELTGGQTGIAALNDGAEPATIDFEWIAIDQEEAPN